MNTMKWLLRREFWEHKGGFFWTPLVVSAIMTVVLAVSLAVAVTMGFQKGVHINGADVGSLSEAMNPEQQAQFIQGLTHGYMGTGAPLFMVLGFVVFFFCLSSLFDERKDRSVLFWKSLPVSDAQSVLAKVVTALVVAPVITVAFATITAALSLLFICIAAAAAGLNIFGAVLGSPAVYLAPFQIAAIIPVYVLWALPTVGWLMMISAWARTKPFLWAVGAPLLTGVLLLWFKALFDLDLETDWYWRDIVARGLLSVAPGSWFGFFHPDSHLSSGPDNINAMALVSQSWRILASANIWIGAAVGSAMIFAAMRLRRWRDEG